MFWRMQGPAQASPIEAILDKESFSLEELLDEDDFIQEVKSLNTRVISHLQQARVIAQLLDYIVVPPLDGEPALEMASFWSSLALQKAAHGIGLPSAQGLLARKTAAELHWGGPAEGSAWPDPPHGTVPGRTQTWD